MPKYVFAVRNCRAKNSTKVEGDPNSKADVSKEVYVEYDGTFNVAARKMVLNELKKKANLTDPKNELEAVLATVAAAGTYASKTTDTYQERVGKAVMQVGAGYHASNMAQAKSGIVWLNLE
jgi:hypothetical protein